MNNLDLIKEKMKQIFKFAEATETVVEELADLQIETVDGIKMSVNSQELTPGSDVYKIDANGVQVTVEDGDYQLIDGRTITVSAGKITNVSGDAQQAAGDNSPVEPAPTSTESMDAIPEVPEMETPTSDVEARIAALEMQLQSIMDMLNGLNANSQAMSEKIQQMSAQPATNGIQPKKVELSNYDNKSTIVDSNKLEEIRKQIRKNNIL